MDKQYSQVSADVQRHIDAVRTKYYAHLEKVSINALFVFSDDEEQVLTHGGYPAAAVTKIVGPRERAAGLADAMIVFDRFVWSALTPRHKAALVDHELAHILPVLDEETGVVKYDSLGRMKLTIRKHDHQIGWFDDVALRHGRHSVEVSQVDKLVTGTGQQLYLDLTAREAA